MTIAARIIDKHAFNGTSTVSSLEWVTLGILGVLVLVFEGINYWLPSEKKKMAKAIQEHFDNYENS